MGGAKAIPINLRLIEVMGFAALYPSYVLRAFLKEEPELPGSLTTQIEGGRN
jgi:hypothetical protein